MKPKQLLAAGINALVRHKIHLQRAGAVLVLSTLFCASAYLLSLIWPLVVLLVALALLLVVIRWGIPWSIRVVADWIGD